MKIEIYSVKDNPPKHEEVILALDFDNSYDRFFMAPRFVKVSYQWIKEEKEEDIIYNGEDCPGEGYELEMVGEREGERDDFLIEDNLLYIKEKDISKIYDKYYGMEEDK